MESVSLSLTDDGGNAPSFLARVGQPTRLQSISSDASLVLVVEPDEFTRSCLSSWLRSSCPEFEVVSATSAESGLETSLPGRPVAAILSDDPGQPGIEWVEQQSGFLRACFPEIPIIAIVRTEKTAALAAACNRLGCRATCRQRPVRRWLPRRCI